MAKLLSKSVWHGVQKDATSWAKQCLQCQTSKVGRHTQYGGMRVPQPERRFGHIHVDVIGPLPPGPAFLSELWSALAQLLGTTHHTTAAYNPAANGLVERFHRSLKASLMARCTTEDWKHQLPWVLLGLRTTPEPTAPHPQPKNLRDSATWRQVRPLQATYTERSATFTPPELSSATHLFVRVDAVRHEELD
ncbi:uncharacterized protein [Macrobrachium rosenbergii]|uniref:uncharacterized protein n=1 Tax=Macrobrachium rosenbergii TaxID=79674 RepID=UPI0034D4CF16